MATGGNPLFSVLVRGVSAGLVAPRGSQDTHKFISVELAHPHPMTGALSMTVGATNEVEVRAWASVLAQEVDDQVRLSQRSSSSLTLPAAAVPDKKHAKSEWDKMRKETVVGNTIIKQGWMKLRGVTKLWSLRYFVLRPPSLLYFKDKEDFEKEAEIGG